MTIRVEGDDYSDFVNKAAAHTASGKYDLAIKEYRDALRLRPDTPEVLNNLAVLYYETKRYEDAYQTAAGIWKTHTELQSAALIAGLSAVQCNRPQEALAPLQQILRQSPGNRDALLGLASAHFALQQFSEAVDIYRRETSLNHTDSLAWYGLAVCLERMAEDESRKLSQMKGGASYSKQLLGEYLQSIGDERLAEEAFGQSLTSTDPVTAGAKEEYQLARRLAGESKSAFETFVSLAPDSWQAEVFLGDIARQHNELVSARDHYQHAANQHPDSPAPDLGLGTVYWELGEFEEARRYLQATLRRNPNAMQAVFELANIAVKQHADEEAIPLLKKFLTAQPNAAAAHADLGRAYLHTAQYEAAIQELTSGLAADQQGDIHYQLSIALRKMERFEEADQALAESTRIRQENSLRDQRLHSIH